MTNKQFIVKAITKNHSGKMEGMISLSVACTKCPLCIKAHNTKDNSNICKHCYSFRMLQRYKTLREKLENNYDFFTTVELNKNDIPFINASMFRFEAFGDISNELQFKNYVLIAEYNPWTTFTLWTKRPQILDNAFNKYGINKPSNLIIIYSEPIIDRRYTSTDFKTLKNKYTFIDKVFTVHSKNGIDDTFINCGAKKCAECKLCYTHNKVTVINERLK